MVSIVTVLFTGNACEPLACYGGGAGDMYSLGYVRRVAYKHFEELQVLYMEV